MISKPVMQNTVDGIASIAGRRIRVYDTEGRLIAASSEGRETADPENRTAQQVARGAADVQEIRGELYFRIMGPERPEYVLALDGTDDNARTIGRMAAFQLAGLLEAYHEKFDEDHYYKNLLLDNLLLVDIYSRARKLQIPDKARRVCLVIRFEQPCDPLQRETVRNLLLSDGTGVLTELDEENLILIYTLPDSEEADNVRKTEIREICEALLEKLEADGITGVRIASGSVTGDLRDLSQSYKEAGMALDVGRIFYPEASVMSYAELGLGRLIYQLPISLCRAFLKDTFGDYRPEEEEEEIRQTIEAFFRNNLNVTEAARELYIHRNTLIYRLEKVQKLTGLDVRVMGDAMTYRIAAMIVDYMKYMEA